MLSSFLKNFDSIYLCVSRFWSDSASWAVILLCIMFCWEISSFLLCKSHSTLQIVWCLNRMTVDEFLVNFVKITDENSSNLINQWFSKLLRMTELWSIHDRDWSSLKLEQKHSSTDLSAFSFQQVRILIYSNNHQSV